MMLDTEPAAGVCFPCGRFFPEGAPGTRQEGFILSNITIQNLTFAYEGSYDNVFDHVSFQIDTDWRLGFTGRNGRGKTTFLMLLMGRYPYSGTISAGVQFEYFPYEVPDRSQLTLFILQELCGDCEQWQLERELNLLEMDVDALYRPFDTLSNGEQTKALLAAMFLKENSFLLIDEPTNHLDQRGRELVSRYLRTKKGFILVSHDRAFLDGCVDHILSINKTDIEVQQGNFSSWWENTERRNQFELAENAKLKKEIRRLTETAREKAQWSDTAEKRKYLSHNPDVDSTKGLRPLQGAKAKKSMARAKAIETRQQAKIEEKSKLLKNIEQSEELKLAQLPYHSARLATLRDVTIDYGGGALFSGLTFEILRGDRIALRGRNGCGKTSLIRLLLGESVPHTGLIQTGSGLKISYVSQDTSALTGPLRGYAEQYGVDETLFLSILRKLDFSRAMFEKDMRHYSGGQKKKVLIARSLSEQAHLHIWDEPMNFIDVISRMQLEELILRHQPTLLFVEHDRAFCENVATKIIDL